MAGVAGLQCRIDELATMTSGVETYMTHIKTTLDTLQTRIEERDL